MRHLPHEVLLLIAASTIRAHWSSRDATLPCGGDLASLNIKGQSPDVVYQQLQEPCQQAAGALSATACRCNLPVYNVHMASTVCQQNQIESWSEWAQANQCNSSQSPPLTIEYDTSAINIPKWAYTNLADGQFDLTTALKDARGWSPIQIATPIIVGVVVALLAVILFYLYRRRHQDAFVGRRRKQKAWQSAHLHAPRRFFGLIPERPTVRPHTSREPQWEIDDNVVLNDELDRVRTDSRTSGHSRMESTTSLLSTNESRHSTNQRSFFDTLASKFSGMSLHKKYQSGTTKSPDYKRVQVVPSDIDAKFAVDGGDLPMPVARQHGRELSGDDVLERRSTLPSVLDIRAPSVAGSQRGRALRNDSLPTTNDGRTDYAPRTVFQSDYSLGTTDLMTPISPSGSDPSEHLRSVRAAHHVQVVNPRSPLIPSAQLDAPMVRDRSTYIERRESTDSLAHQLYPRGPSYEY